MANADEKAQQSQPGEHTSEVAARAAEIARGAVNDPDLLKRVDEIAPELAERRKREVPVGRYMAGVQHTVVAYVEEYVEVSTLLDRRLSKPNSVEAHLKAAASDVGLVARGMWEILAFLPELNGGAVVVEAGSKQLKPVTSVKAELIKRQISDDSRHRSLAMIQPDRMLRAARFELAGSTKAEREAEAIRLLGEEGAQQCAQNGTMCLSVLAASVAAGETTVEGFSANVVRARLPSGHVRRKGVVGSEGAGADVFSLETVAWCRMADGSCGRFRVLDLGLTSPEDATAGPDAALVQEQVVESLALIEEMLPEARRVLVLPYDLPLGPPHAGRDVLTTRVAEDRLADHVRAQAGNRIAAADFVAAVAPRLPGWAILAPIVRGRSDIYSLQRQIRASRTRDAFALKTVDNFSRTEWLGTTPGSWESREQQEELRLLAQEWHGQANPEGLDQRRPAGHRVMFHGNIREEPVKAMTQAFLTYTLAEEIGLPPEAG